ncbi:MAG: glycoside hydrolase family 3 [Tyzzerella sp.]|uniref:beta-N-acetylhexosaminidase n=1 Tax=Candidatus Fimicola merdigallinarum TaxID=2840819 RepID=A0A9D9DX05_9FIRM|nr:glycoside hydrolase family 3 [Candidatus Fimicola merdigallinarum]
MKRLITILLTLFILSGCSNVKSDDYTSKDLDIKGETIIEKTPEEIREDYINEFMSDMTLEEKAGQMIMVAFRSDSNGNPVTAVNDEIVEAIQYIKPGGVILFGENIDTENQTIEYIENLQGISKTPLFIGIDEEGGRVSRLHSSGNIITPQIPTAEYMGKNYNEKQVMATMGTIANEIKRLGFNVDFAPVADINTNPENTVIGDRAFGSDPETVSMFVISAIKGLQRNNVSACVKHFPGHGDTYTDTHTTETFVNHDIERLNSCELIPFKNAFETGVDFAMVSHIKVPNVDNSGLPSSLSKTIINDILRNQLGFKGIIITDALDMGAISNYYTEDEIAKYGIDAGVDIFLMPKDAKALYDYIVKGLKDGSIDEDRINQSVRRILEVKYNRGIL